VNTKPTLLLCVPCVCSASSGKGHTVVTAGAHGEYFRVENMLLEGPASGLDAVEKKLVACDVA
jgi:hypothetical protein